MKHAFGKWKRYAYLKKIRHVREEMMSDKYWFRRHSFFCLDFAVLISDEKRSITFNELW